MDQSETKEQKIRKYWVSMAIAVEQHDLETVRRLAFAIKHTQGFWRQKLSTPQNSQESLPVIEY